MKDIVVGSFEKVSLPSLGVKHELAKIDTGAYSGALHCSNIKEHIEPGATWGTLSFTPLGQRRLRTSTTKYARTYVRSASGHKMKRYMIDTEILLKGNRYPIRIGLSNRKDMQRSILIGRRFLRDNSIIVDVRVNQEYDDEGKIR